MADFAALKAPRFEKVLNAMLSGRLEEATRTLSDLRRDLSTDAEIALYRAILRRAPRAKLYVDAQHGLGNRIRALASGAAIAQATNRQFIVVWQPDHHCECHFRDLFAYGGDVMSESFLNEAAARIDVTNYMEIESGSTKDGPISLTLGKDAYVRSAYYFVTELSDTASELAFMRSLVPALPVRRLMDGIDSTNCVGVHVRMEGATGQDLQSYDSPENWPHQDHVEIQAWRAKSHYSRFFDRLDEVLASRPEMLIFLASDTFEAYSVFAERYGDRCLALRRTKFDRSAEQLQYALADALLLSRCPILLGSNWSSFTELAMNLAAPGQIVEFSGVDF